MSAGTAMLWRRTEFPPSGGLVRLAHWAKRAYTSPCAYRKLTASRLPVSSGWSSAASPKRVTAATACRASAGVTASWALSRAPSRPSHNQDSLGLITAGETDVVQRGRYICAVAHDHLARDSQPEAP